MYRKRYFNMIWYIILGLGLFIGFIDFALGGDKNWGE